MSDDKLERIARVLVEATMAGPKGDAKICARHGISIRTLQNYRKRLESDDELARICAEKKAVAIESWSQEVPAAMRASVDFLRRAAESGDPSDPQMVHSIAGSLKMLSEVAATWKVLDARISRQAGPLGAEPGQGSASSNVTQIRRPA